METRPPSPRPDRDELQLKWGRLSVHLSGHRIAWVVGVIAAGAWVYMILHGLNTRP